MPVNITAQYNLLNPTAEITASGGGNGTTTVTTSISSYSAAGQAPSKHAAGGFVSGKQLSWLAEEGYGEFVIPTNPSRRARALELYEQAGAMLGVGAHAAGGYVGGNRDSISSGNHLADEETASYDYEEGALENGGSNGITYYDSGNSGGADVAGNSMPIQINVNMAPEINIQSSEGGNGENIAETVMERILGMVDELGGEMASRLIDVFSNMPMEGA